ncbi:NAD(P)/FAD-dependent oxidoreductase [candidate division WWE3 bacterium]|uniref:NAD(P)/FAD-dependent oxidoreductase n=1 Tax=candidate division WWE3 bacterium TaxID=2053526 RepID=A0A955RS45_UNCKA|nr:NAD(P)/FAD-dependent oxidoreductase [candidate division WWE3 bacterium]
MKIAIVGGGFTGLSAAYYLQKTGHNSHIFENASYLGGLAAGVKSTLSNPPENWEWDLEQFYHHWFTNDNFVFELGEDIGVTDKFKIKGPRTDVLYDDKMYPLDSPLALLKFPHLSFVERIRTGMTMAKLKYLYNEASSDVFENVTAAEYLQNRSSKDAYEKIWKPLLVGKFGQEYDQVNMRWFWARIYKRTPKLAYYEGGFGAFANDIAEAVRRNNGSIDLNVRVEEIVRCDTCNGFHVKRQGFENTHEEVFDRVIVTTPPQTLQYFYPELPEAYKQSLRKHEGVGAFALVLRLHHQLMPETYWLSINETSWPFLAVVEHTNFMPKDKYGGENILYVGDYVQPDHPNMQKSKEELIADFTPYLKRINPLFSSESIIDSYLFKTNYAQPIPKLNHERHILPLTTPVEGLYLASMAQVYPWDRGTNYAIEMGKEVAGMISN